MTITRRCGVATAIVVALGLAGCTAPAPPAPTEMVVGVVTSRTGPASLDGADWTLGFEAGLDAATDGTEKVGGIRVVVDYRDDAGDTATASALAGELLDEGATVLAGPVADGTALAVADSATAAHALFIAGSATTDALTGRSRWVFRSGHQVSQEVAAATAMLGDVSGRAVAVLCPDDAAGQAMVATASAVLAARGAAVTPVTPAADSTDFVKPVRDMVFPNAPAGVIVRWPGAGAPELWRDAADIPDALTRTMFTTQLGDPGAWRMYGPATSQTAFVSAWIPGAVSGADAALMAATGDGAAMLGPAAADGYVAALMVVHAIEGGTDVGDMIEALEGASLDGPAGSVTIRASDHALLADQFRIALAADGTASVTAVLAAADLAPVETPIPTESPTATD